jgi:hypothetical protein
LIKGFPICGQAKISEIFSRSQLGHSSSKQTDHYAKITQTNIMSGIKAYDQNVRGPNIVEMFGEQETDERLDKARQNKKPAETLIISAGSPKNGSRPVAQ